MNTGYFLINCLTQDENLKQLIYDYWRVDDVNEDFTYSNYQLRIKYGKSICDLRKDVKKNSFTYDLIDVCNCGNVWEQAKPTESRRVVRKHSNTPWYTCWDCMVAQREKENAAITMRVEEALLDNRDHQLNKLEYEIFKEMVLQIEEWEIRKRKGMSLPYFEKVLQRLEALELLIITNGRMFFASDYTIIFSNEKAQPGYRRIFGSENNYRLHQQLRREYAFVHPEVPMAAFIIKEKVQHLFTETWQENYFLRCRFDALICDREGMPLLAVEFQSSRHEEESVANHDNFKKEVLASVGLQVRTLSYRDLV
jgi:hypothetical protein